MQFMCNTSMQLPMESVQPYSIFQDFFNDKLRRNPAVFLTAWFTCLHYMDYGSRDSHNIMWPFYQALEVGILPLAAAQERIRLTEDRVAAFVNLVQLPQGNFNNTVDMIFNAYMQSHAPEARNPFQAALDSLEVEISEFGDHLDEIQEELEEEDDYLEEDREYLATIEALIASVFTGPEFYTEAGGRKRHRFVKNKPRSRSRRRREVKTVKKSRSKSARRRGVKTAKKSRSRSARRTTRH